MTIFFLGYFDKFSRFFYKIDLELSREFKDLKSKYYSTQLSGFFYSFLRLKRSIPITFSSWFNVLFNRKKYLKIIEQNQTYKGINFESLIQFHEKLDNGIPRRHLLLQAISYIDILNKQFSKNRPDVVIMIGDSRLFFEVSKAIAIKFDVKVYFIEQGPFDTTIFNSQGVNANMKVDQNHQFKNHNVTTKITQLISNKNNQKYNRSYVYRGLDFLVDKLLHKTILYPPDLKSTDIFQLPLNKTADKPIISKNKQHLFLLILQVPQDVNMILHSPNFSNHFDIVKQCFENLPEHSKLVIREHPVYKGKYKQKLYDYAYENNIEFDHSDNATKIINLSDVVIVNNSTIGVKVLSMYKPLIVLGNSYYSDSNICLVYQSGDDLKDYLLKALTFQPEKQNIDTFLLNLEYTHLVSGKIIDKHLSAATEIANRIKISHFND
ncbi:MAG: hypothetical protein ED556_10455 [Winogradskyella sp.]|uniref:capsular polysaccharide export protein, LipB/KpsS family n=1 Tax=Winogradskyella sp. TaxID=1883156 RepID=UPI000F3F56A1|nr:hypothetical protein [Winogradskyella sp.]RNC84984.1 MAG: hypothetical protein ED556_10455 [Winogradskyella sp.]